MRSRKPLLGQETVTGKFTLTENTRLGKSFLPAGAYTFTIEPAGILQSVSSIQGARQIVQVTVRPETKAGPVAAISQWRREVPMLSTQASSY